MISSLLPGTGRKTNAIGCFTREVFATTKQSMNGPRSSHVAQARYMNTSSQCTRSLLTYLRSVTDTLLSYAWGVLFLQKTGLSATGGFRSRGKIHRPKNVIARHGTRDRCDAVSCTNGNHANCVNRPVDARPDEPCHQSAHARVDRDHDHADVCSVCGTSLS